jgi:hypothetical protein
VIDLTEWLRLTGYPLPDRHRILTSLLDHGTLAHAAESRLLDPEDYPLAEALFCESQPEIPYDDPAWDCPDTWELGPPIPPGTVLVPPELDDSDPLPMTPEGKVDWRTWRKQLGLPEIPPPISGGAPDDTPGTLERIAQQVERILCLEAQLAAIPEDWRLHYYPF